MWLLVAVLTFTFNLRWTSTTEAKKNEVIAIKYDDVKVMEVSETKKSETVLEVAATGHAARTGMAT